MLEPLGLLGWLKAAWPYGGTAVVGSGMTLLVTRYSSRHKVSQTERHLYKEMALNYIILHRAIEEPIRMADAASGLKPLRLHLDYYHHAIKDMDTLMELKHYDIIRAVYRNFHAANDARGMSTSQLIVGARLTLTESLVNGHLNRNLFTKESPAWLRPVLDEHISERHSLVHD